MQITKEELEMLRAAAAARGEGIARRMRDIEVMRRALWLRIDLVEKEVARSTAYAAARPPATAGAEAPVGAAQPVAAVAAGGAQRDATAPAAAAENAEPASVRARFRMAPNVALAHAG